MSQDLENIRRGYEALSRLDLDAWLGDVCVDAELHEIAEMPDTAVYRGHDELRRWVESRTEAIESWQWTPEEFIHEAGDTVLIRVRLNARGRGSGLPIEGVVFHVIEMKDAKLARVRGFLNREKALEAVGLSEQDAHADS